MRPEDFELLIEQAEQNFDNPVGDDEFVLW